MAYWSKFMRTTVVKIHTKGIVDDHYKNMNHPQDKLLLRQEKWTDLKGDVISYLLYTKISF